MVRNTLKYYKDIHANVVLSLPDFSKEFYLETEESDVRIDAILTQEAKIIVFYNTKLINS